MKNVFKTFMILLVSLIVVPFTVNAATTTYEDLPNGSYVIGKHIFTREGGALTVKKIMLASRTIEADNIENMHIIYKDIMGNLKEVSNGKDIDTNQYPDADIELTDEIYYEYYDLVKVIYTDGVIASAPKLGNLVPIKYNGENWEYANTSKEWYNYSADVAEWANAVVLSSGVEKNVGDSISEDEIDLWFVWVPRYEYKLPEESIGTIETPNAIDINFISSSVTEPTEGYSFHPGFAWDSDWSNGISEWKDGIWVGKFESTALETETNAVQKIMIKPNVQSWRNVSVSNMYTSGLNLDTDYGITNLDSHMTRYTEWTAVSYLTNSVYGLCSSSTSCTEVTINTSSTYMSGMEDYKTNVNLSTTRNITGIYDIAGSAMEYVIGYLPNENWYSEFDVLPIDNKYTDVFTSSDTSKQNYSVITHINGQTSMNGVFGELLSDKTKTASWYNDFAYSVLTMAPWFVLGGSVHRDGYGAGAFASHITYGDAYSSSSFRVALS